MKNYTIAMTGMAAFFVIFGLSIFFESPALLYIASLIPIFVVPFLPDIRSNQYIKPGKNSRTFEVIQVCGNQESPTDTLVLFFPPDAIYWNRKILYISIDDIPRVSHLPNDDLTVTLTILKHDLRFNRKKKNQIGIYLPNLIERTRNLPYTIREVNRLIIRMEDIREQFMPANFAVSGKNVRINA